MNKAKENLLQEAKKQEKRKIDEIREEYKPVIEKIRIIEKLKKSKKRNSTFFVNANNILCYQSLAFCCDLIKPCIWRESCLKLLGFSNKDFSEMKDRFTRKILEKFKEVKKQSGG